MEVTKLSDFLKQQGDTPQGKSTYQAFIDNFDKDYDAESFRKDEKCSIAAAFQWDICPEDLEFWDKVDNKWQEVTDLLARDRDYIVAIRKAKKTLNRIFKKKGYECKQQN